MANVAGVEIVAEGECPAATDGEDVEAPDDTNDDDKDTDKDDNDKGKEVDTTSAAVLILS